MKKTFIKNIYLLIICCSIPITVFALNYHGFCFREFRFLSSQERMRYLFNISRISRNPKNESIFVNGEYKTLKRKNTYSSFDEFLEKHPNCCEIDPGGPYKVDPPIFTNKILGYDSSPVIHFKFDEEFIDSDGNILTVEVEIVDRLQNCGEHR